MLIKSHLGKALQHLFRMLVRIVRPEVGRQFLELVEKGVNLLAQFFRLHGQPGFVAHLVNFAVDRLQRVPHRLQVVQLFQRHFEAFVLST